MTPLVISPESADLERRFAGVRRLHGSAAYERLRAARVAIVGVGGVGSWAAEALARSGVAELTLIDLDHIAESNINRQIQALHSTLGQAKVLALQERIAQIHPHCQVHPVEEFVDESNVADLLSGRPVDALIDCCDQVAAKAALMAWAWQHRCKAVTVGAAGGKSRPQDVQVADLSEVTHDPLLASLRRRLRQHHGASRQSRMDVSCVFSRESVKPAQDDSCAADGSLNCHGYGSVVTVTAVFGMVAAAQVMSRLIEG